MLRWLRGSLVKAKLLGQCKLLYMALASQRLFWLRHLKIILPDPFL